MKPPDDRLKQAADDAIAAMNDMTHMSDSSADERYERFLSHFLQDRDRLLAYVCTLLPHRADAEDVFQRCSMRLWEKFESFEQERSFLAWARGVAFYEVKNFLRVSSRDRLYFDPDLMSQLSTRRAEDDEMTEDRLAALRDCLKRIGNQDRQLIAKVYEYQSSVKDVATEGGLALQTLYNRLSRVRKKLFDCVQMKTSQGAIYE